MDLCQTDKGDTINNHIEKIVIYSLFLLFFSFRADLTNFTCDFWVLILHSMKMHHCIQNIYLILLVTFQDLEGKVIENIRILIFYRSLLVVIADAFDKIWSINWMLNFLNRLLFIKCFLVLDDRMFHNFLRVLYQLA